MFANSTSQITERELDHAFDAFIIRAAIESASTPVKGRLGEVEMGFFSDKRREKFWRATTERTRTLRDFRGIEVVWLSSHVFSIKLTDLPTASSMIFLAEWKISALAFLSGFLFTQDWLLVYLSSRLHSIILVQFRGMTVFGDSFLVVSGRSFGTFRWNITASNEMVKTPMKMMERMDCMALDTAYGRPRQMTVLANRCSRPGPDVDRRTISISHYITAADKGFIRFLSLSDQVRLFPR